jgi:hypothetical protein
MPSAFNVTTTDNDLKLKDSRQGVVALTVSNISGKAQDGRLALVALDPTQAAWLGVVGNATRTFPVGGAEQFAVQIAVPKDAAPGRYTYRPDVAAVANPDEDSTTGPVLAFEVPAVVVVVVPWWRKYLWPLVAAAVALLVLIGVLAYLLVFSVIVPDVVNQDVAAAQTAVAGVGLQAGTPTPATTLRVASGVVLTQVPAGGARVARNSTVELVVEQNVVVPNVLNATFSSAQNTLTLAGLKSTGVDCFSSFYAVIGENPQFNTKVAPGTTIQLTCRIFVPVPTPTRVIFITPFPIEPVSP